MEQLKKLVSETLMSNKRFNTASQESFILANSHKHKLNQESIVSFSATAQAPVSQPLPGGKGGSN
jgi:hypothetical protein